MREVKRQIHRSQGLLRRSADGSLRVNGEVDVADIWAEGDRIRLADAIERDRRKAEKKRRRREGELFGFRKPVFTNAAKGTKEIEIKISLPKLRLKEKFRNVRLPKLTKRQWAVVGASCLLLAFIVSTQGIYNKSDKPNAAIGSSSAPSVSGKVIGGDKPDFTTILPTGKTIDKLGGWGRVSPPTSAPVFAYSDMLGGTHIVVSEQQVPASFENNLQGQVAQIAKQLGATTKLQTANGTALYSGVTTSGVQSLVLSKADLLILIRTVSRVDNKIMEDYVDNLN
jgi:molybdopterin-binding protein